MRIHNYNLSTLKIIIIEINVFIIYKDLLLNNGVISFYIVNTFFFSLKIMFRYQNKM